MTTKPNSSLKFVLGLYIVLVTAGGSLAQESTGETPQNAATQTANEPPVEMSPEEMIREATRMLEEAKVMLEGDKVDKSTATPTEPAAKFTKFDALIAGLSIFVLAVFVGFEVITKVPPTLHTPLMSGSNAISGITLVGALVVAGRNGSLLGVLAVLFAMINVIGGFWVTHRMLSMFKR